MSILVLTTGGMDPIEALNEVLDILLAEEDGAACPRCGIRAPHCHAEDKARLA
jgi:hypothetical protein